MVNIWLMMVYENIWFNGLVSGKIFTGNPQYKMVKTMVSG
jgi:hypothetical protein